MYLRQIDVKVFSGYNAHLSKTLWRFPVQPKALSGVALVLSRTGTAPNNNVSSVRPRDMTGGMTPQTNRYRYRDQKQPERCSVEEMQAQQQQEQM